MAWNSLLCPFFPSIDPPGDANERERESAPPDTFCRQKSMPADPCLLSVRVGRVRDGLAVLSSGRQNETVAPTIEHCVLLNVAAVCHMWLAETRVSSFFRSTSVLSVLSFALGFFCRRWKNQPLSDFSSLPSFSPSHALLSPTHRRCVSPRMSLEQKEMPSIACTRPAAGKR